MMAGVLPCVVFEIRKNFAQLCRLNAAQASAFQMEIIDHKRAACEFEFSYKRDAAAKPTLH